MPNSGWYPSPGEPGMLRWWNGDAWGAQRQSVPAVPAQAAAVGAADVAASSPGWKFRWAWQRNPDGTLVSDSINPPNGQSPLRRSMAGFVIGGFLILASIAAVVFLAVFVSVPPGDVTTKAAVTGTNSVYQPAVSTAPGGTSGGGYVCFPIATYTVDGSTYTATSNVGSSDCLTFPGQTATVAYDPANPANGRVVTSIGFTWPVLLFGVGGAFLIYVNWRMYRARLLAASSLASTRSYGPPDADHEARR